MTLKYIHHIYEAVKLNKEGEGPYMPIAVSWVTGRGQRCNKLDIEGPMECFVNTTYGDKNQGRVVCRTEGRVKFDDGEWED